MVTQNNRHIGTVLPEHTKHTLKMMGKNFRHKPCRQFYMAYVEVIIFSQTFPLYCIVFRSCLFRTRFSQKLGYLEEVFRTL